MKKKFGQHLLTDKNYLFKIVDSLKLKQSDTVLEIGAGSGLLTVLIAPEVKEVFAVEIERGILKKLKENINKKKLTNIEIIECDFLKLDLCCFAKKYSIKSFKIVGNIPYNITSKILIKLFGEIDKVAPHSSLLHEIYLMLQYEVAQRVVAKLDSKEYSPLTLLVQYFSNPKILFNVPGSAFYPIPKVDSSFVRFVLKEKLQVIDKPELLKDIIRISFQQRRKKIINALNKVINDRNKIINVFAKLNLNYNLRPEDLSFEDFLSISNNI